MGNGFKWSFLLFWSQLWWLASPKVKWIVPEKLSWLTQSPNEHPTLGVYLDLIFYPVTT